MKLGIFLTIGLSLFPNTAIPLQAQGLEISQNIPLEKAPNLPERKSPDIKPIAYNQLGSERIKGTPSVVSWGSNRIDVFVQGTDDTLYRTYLGSI